MKEESRRPAPSNPLIALAPMQDVTDIAFMRTLSRIGCLPDFFMTPYLRSTRTTCAMMDSPLRCIMENETGVPIWAQLAGSEVEALQRDARRLLELPIAGINLNAGCPAPLVNRHGAGAALLRDRVKLKEICCALRDILPTGQWSVKCRLGWEDVTEFPYILDALRPSNPDLLMVHARTRKQLYSGSPDVVTLRREIGNMNCPVLGNGDINSVEQAFTWLRHVTPAGILIGRGAVRNPYLLRELMGGKAATHHEMQQYYLTLIEETGKTLKRATPMSHCNRMKKYLAFCYEDFLPEIEHDLRRCTDPIEMERLLISTSVPRKSEPNRRLSVSDAT